MTLKAFNRSGSHGFITRDVRASGKLRMTFPCFFPHYLLAQISRPQVLSVAVFNGVSQTESPDATCMSESCEVTSLLLAHHPPRLLQYLYSGHRVSPTGSLVGRVPRYKQ